MALEDKDEVDVVVVDTATLDVGVTIAVDVTVEVKVWVAVEGYVEETDCGCVLDQVFVM